MQVAVYILRVIISIKIVKYNELDYNIPRITNIQRIIRGNWSLKEIKKAELRVLDILGFSLKSLTAYDFLHSFLYNFYMTSSPVLDKAVFDSKLNYIIHYLNTAYSCIFQS